jgi:putative nucleotidyltransferase with HDIG domain
MSRSADYPGMTIVDASRAGQARGDGRGRVLAAAFDEADHLPALDDAGERALELVARGAPPHDVAAVVEGDVGLTVAVIRAAGQLPGGGRIRSAAGAVESLGPGAMEAVLRATPTYDSLGADGRDAAGTNRFHLHALAVQRAADRIAEITGTEGRDELALAAILHDIGRPVLVRLHPGYAERFDPRGATPDERHAAERRELGIDHALVGGVLARRWGLHARIAEAIERHHSPEAEGSPATLRTADMIAALLEDAPVNPDALRQAAERCELGEAGIRRVLYELPRGEGPRRKAGGPCPLSGRELEVLRRLAEGKVYKQIAAELGLSASTVRSHLHNVYGKLGALDRAQAVLMATDHGWI